MRLLNRFSRRDFLQTTIKGTAATMAASAMAASTSTLASAMMTSKKKNRKLGVALVGLGYYSTDLLAPALQLTEHCALRGIVTGSPKKIPVWQKRYGIKDENVYNYENMHTVADNPDINVIYIVLPTFLHKKYSVIAANAGKHVWCEKPMAMTVSECQEIIDACNKNRVKLSIGYRLQHEPNTQTLVQFAETKPYGAIKHVVSEAGYDGNGFAPDNWKMYTSKGGGALYDMGVYPINAARYATGMEPVAISATAINPDPKKFQHTDPAAKWTLSFPGDVEAACQTSTLDYMNHLKVDCEKGWYELKPMQSYTGVKGRTSDGKQLDKQVANQQAKQMDDDALAILHDRQVLVPGQEGLNDIRVVEAAFRSIKAGGKEVKIS